MTKIPKDFSKGLIYKIVCLDPDITDCYVGSSTNFKQRKSQHKNTCNSPNQRNYNCNVYKFIREHGGWENWQMLQIEEYPCNSSHELALRERFHFENLKASLNSCVPSRSHAESNIAYYQNNRDTINTKKKEKHDCPCGGSYTLCNKAQHIKRKIHQAYLNQNDINELNTNTNIESI
jgi:hypothetical protein